MLEVLSRIQFAFTIAFHFIFVPLSIGLILLIAIFETIHLRKGNDEYRKLSDYFGNMFIIMYAVGIVTGIAMTLQFGTNWGAYSKFMGDVFGAPLALEALIAFFLESTFTGIYVFRRDKISPKFRCVTTWMITIGTAISALWIITAAGFMHNPVGYELSSDKSQVILVDIFKVLLNPYAWYMLIHTVSSAMLLGGFFVLAVASHNLLKPNLSETNKNTFIKASKIAAITSLIMSLIVPAIGNTYYNYISNLYTDTTNMSAAITNAQGSVKLDAINGANQLVSISFILMVTIGVILIVLSLYTVVFHKRYVKSPVLQKIFKYAFILPYIAIMAGWIVTEVGRQPWVVYGLLKTIDGISQVPVSSVMFSLVTIAILYLTTFAVTIHMMKVQVRKNIDDQEYLYDGKES